MIDPIQLSALQEWGKSQKGPNTIQMHARRGAVYIYEFREKLVMKGEPWQMRPVIIMDPDPDRRIRERLDLHVVPMSTQLIPYNQGALNIQFEQQIRSAIFAQATTINSQRLGNYRGNISDIDMRKISEALISYMIKGAHDHGRDKLAVGNKFLIPWHDNSHSKLVEICGAGHLQATGLNRPVLALPVIKLGNVEDVAIKPRPLAASRFKGSRLEGQAPLREVLGLQCAVLGAYGITHGNM